MNGSVQNPCIRYGFKSQRWIIAIPEQDFRIMTWISLDPLCVRVGPVLWLEQYQGWNSIRVGPVSGLDQYQGWTSIRVSGLDQYQGWTSIRVGTVSGLDQYQSWTSIRVEPVSGLDQYQGQTSIRVGPVSGLDQYQGWTSIMVGSSCHEQICIECIFQIWVHISKMDQCSIRVGLHG